MPNNTMGLVQVIFQGSTGLAEDQYVNTFHFNMPGVPFDDVAANSAMDHLVDFFNGTHAPSTSPLANEITTNITRSASRMKAYNLGDPIPRVPIAERTWTLGATASPTNYPNEVALCLSFQGERISGENQARRRGRVFIGPLCGNGTSSGGDVVPSATTIAKLTNAAIALAGTADPTWCVYSRADDEMVPVVDGWVDNAYDTQRRRGKAAAARTIWT
jgi:hypothetical protein